LAVLPLIGTMSAVLTRPQSLSAEHPVRQIQKRREHHRRPARRRQDKRHEQQTRDHGKGNTGGSGSGLGSAGCGVCPEDAPVCDSGKCRACRVQRECCGVANSGMRCEWGSVSRPDIAASTARASVPVPRMGCPASSPFVGSPCNASRAVSAKASRCALGWANRGAVNIASKAGGPRTRVVRAAVARTGKCVAMRMIRHSVSSPTEEPRGASCLSRGGCAGDGCRLRRGASIPTAPRIAMTTG
jgi:hypothetical protein